MVVIAIISLLVVFLVLGFSGGGRSAGVKATRALFLQLAEGCDRFKGIYGFYPPDQAGRQRPETAFNPAGDPAVRLDVLVALGAQDTTPFTNRTDLESNECLTFCLLLDRRGGPLVTLKQKQLANLDGDSVALYLDTNGDFRYQGGEALGQQALLEVLDAWGTPVRYLAPTGRDPAQLRELKSPGTVEIYSAGPDGSFGWNPGNPVSLDEDDIASWQPAVE
jgi:type II secretory pathway pseudopilin PulG